MDKAPSLTSVVTALAAHFWARSRPPDTDAPEGAVRPERPDPAAGLHALVAAMLGADPALDQLVRENAAGVARPTASPRTSRRIVLALEEALDGDPHFAADLAAVMAGIHPTHPPALQPHPLNGPAFASASPSRQNGGRW